MIPMFWGVANTPYCDLHNLNLDWVLKVCKDFQITMEKLPELLDEALKEKVSDERLSQLILTVLENYEFYINVKAPGNDLMPCVGDGVTDDTDALRAIMEFNRESPKALYFPVGSYLVSEFPAVESVLFIGADKDNTAIIRKGEKVLCENLVKMAFKEITFDGSFSRNQGENPIFKGDFTKVRFTDCNFKDCYCAINAESGSQFVADRIGCYNVAHHVFDFHCDGAVVDGLSVYDMPINYASRICGVTGSNCCFTNIRIGANVPSGFVIRGDKNYISGSFDHDCDFVRVQSGTGNNWNIHGGEDNFNSQNGIIYNHELGRYSDYFDKVRISDENGKPLEVLIANANTAKLGVASGAIEYTTARKYIDSVNGDDSNDGEQATPWKTLDRFFEELARGASVRAYIVSAGVYTSSVAVMSGATVHITANVPGVTLNFVPANGNNTFYIYDSHLSFTTADDFKMDITGVYFKCENCSTTIYKTNFLSGFNQVGGYIGFQHNDFRPNATVSTRYTVDISGCMGYFWDCRFYGSSASNSFPLYLHNGASVVMRQNDDNITGFNTFIAGQNGSTAPIYVFCAKMTYFDNNPSFEGTFAYGLRASSGQIQIPNTPYNAFQECGSDSFTGASLVVRSNHLVFPAIG